MTDTKLKVLRRAEVIAICGLSKTTIHELTHQGLFPPNFKLGQRAAGYLEHEIQAFMAARIAELNDTQMREVVANLLNSRKQISHKLLPVNYREASS